MPVVSIRQWPDADSLAVPNLLPPTRQRPAVAQAPMEPIVSPKADMAQKATARVTIDPLLASQLLMLQQ